VEEIASNAVALDDEISLCRPRYIGLVGLHSARALIADDIDMEWAHGLPFKGLRREAVSMPLYHPAAGLHQPAIGAKIAYDFAQFGRMVRGEKLSTGHLAVATTTQYSEVEDDIEGAVPVVAPYGPVCAMDTEGNVDNPWCASFSAKVGTGVVV